MKHALALFLTLVLITPSAADDTADRMVAAERYVSAPAVQEMMTAMIAPDALLSRLQGDLGALAATERETASTIISEEIAEVRPMMENAMMKAIAETLTLAEIEAVDAFYRTPEGAAVLRKTQPMMANFSNRFGPIMRQMQRKASRRLKEELR